MAELHSKASRDESPSLRGKSALVIGGNSGVGRATAVALAGLGAHVVISGRDEARGNQVVQDIRSANGQADFVAGELRDEASAHALAGRTRILVGQVDILVNNAAVTRSAPPNERVSRTSTRCSR